MNTTTILLSSSTYAAKAKKKLSKVGIDAKVIKISGEDGCTYGIKISSEYFYSAIYELKNQGISYRII